MNLDKKIDAAVNHFLLVNCSYDGSMLKASGSVDSKIVANIKRVLQDLLFAAIVMKDIRYELADYKKTTVIIINNPNALDIADPPYMRLFLIGYKYEDHDFTHKDMDELFDLLRHAKCKVIFFHSHNWRISTMCEAAGLKFVGNYKKGYTTDIFTKNISDDERAFISKAVEKLRKTKEE